MNIYEKLAAVQQEVKAPKNLKNTHMKFNYRSAEGILEAVKPILAQVGAMIILFDDVTEISGRVYVKSTAQFVDLKVPDYAQQISVTAYAREAESKQGLDVAQVTGSASSYARKYALNGLLLLDDAKQDPDTEEMTRRVEEQEKLKPTMKQSILTMADLCGVKLDDILKKPLDDMTEQEAGKLLLALKEKHEAQGKN